MPPFMWKKSILFFLWLTCSLASYGQQKHFQPILGSPLLGPINCLSIDDNNIVWAGTEQGLLKINGSRKELFTPSNSALRDEHINCLLIDRNQTKWMGSYKRGLMKLDAKGRFAHYPFEGGFLYLITDLAINSSGQLFIATMQQGIFKLSDDVLTPLYNKSNSRLPSNAVYSIGFLPNGNLWAGTDRGLATLENGKFKTESAIVGVRRLLALGPRLIACGLSGKGPQLWEYTKHWNTAPELCNPLPTLKGIIKGDHFLWLNTDEGLLRFDGQACRRFDKRQGLQQEALTAAAIDTAGNVWVGSAAGNILALLPEAPLPPPTPPKPIAADNLTPNKTAILQKVSFQRGTATLTDSTAALEELQELVNYWKANPNFSISITGHTSDQGSAIDNWILSKKRALAIQQLLQQLGIPASSIYPSWEGERKPLVPNNSESNRQKNRRVEILFKD